MRQSYFDAIADAVCQPVGGTDRVTLSYSAEATDFLRFNHALVRQATNVAQHYGSVSVIQGARKATGTVALTGHASADTLSLLAERDALAVQLPLVPEDAHLMLPQALVSTAHDAAGQLPSPREVIDAVAAHAAGADFVGIYTGGPVVRAFADSRGQRNWHSVESFLFEWCLYRQADQAVKTSYAGTSWDAAEFAGRVASAREQLGMLARPRRALQPGAYRAYFSPVAVADLLGTLGWSGFSRKAVNTGVSALVLMHRGEAVLHPSIRWSEDAAGGIAPRFQPDGFVKPDSVALVEGGKVAGTLVSPRSAAEYGLASNGANADEYPESLAMAPGMLAPSQVLEALGTGVYISDLHYLNYSDRQACRMTGLTRFACFWVEDGKLAAPIEVMRFDDSLLRMFGEGLVALSSKAELIPDNRTYGSRFLSSVTAPGALVEGFKLTL